MLLTIERDDLINLLGKAYDAGWRGARELKSFVVEELLEEFEKAKPEESKEAIAWTVDMNGSSEMVTIDVNNFAPITVEISDADIEAEEEANRYWNNSETMWDSGYRVRFGGFNNADNET